MEARFSLKQFLIAALVILPIVMVGVVVFTAHQTIKLVSQDIAHRNLMLAQAMANQVNTLLERSQDLLQEIKSDLSEWRVVTRSRVNRYLSAKVKENSSYFTEILILDARGLVVHAGPHPDLYLNTDFSQHPLFLRVKQTHKPYWSSTFISAHSGRPTMSISLPLGDGVMVGYLDLDNLQDTVKQLNLGSKGYAAVVDQKGLPLAHSQGRVVAQMLNLGDIPVVARALQGQRGTFNFEYQGRRWLGSVARIRQTGWLVVIVQSQAAAFSQVRRLTQITWMGIAFLGLMVLLAALWGFRKVEHPLAVLVANARRAASGDYQFAPPRGMFREVAELSSAFQAMIEAVESREQELRRSRQNLRALVESSNDAIITLDSQRRIASCNRAFLELFGFSRRELVGEPIGLIHPDPESYRRFGETVYPQVHQEGSWRGEWRYRKKSGEEIFTESAIAVLRLPGEDIEGYVAIMRDITERKRAQDALRESRELYRMLVEESFDGIFVQKGSRIVFANSRLYQMLGYPEGELVGLEHWRVYHPDYHQLTRDRARARMRGEDVPSHYEVRLQRKDGSSFPAELIAHAIMFEGQPGVQVCLRDITERKRARRALRQNQRRLQAILQASPDPVVVYDEKGNTTFANPAFTRVFGWTLEELQGGRIPFVPQEEQERTFSTIDRLYANGKSVSLESRRLTKSGELRDVFISAAAIRDKSGRPTGMVVNLTDITERKLLEDQLRQAQKMEAIGTLAGGIAHDFNNILGAIVGYTELAMYKSRLGEPVQGEMGQALKAAERASDLVKRILTFSRRVDTERKPLDLNLEVLQTVKMLERTIPKMISIELHLADDLWIIEGDGSQLEQVLMNLGTNARDAMPEGGRLVIETENVILDQDYSDRHLGAAPGRYVLLTFSDTGHGMDSDTLGHIFDPFFTTKGVGEGTGLGLAMVYGIVKNHGGHIIAYSQPGQGTAFKLYFPAVQGDSAQAGEERGPLVQTQGGHESILLVDDEESILEIGQNFLESFGYKVMTAASGEEALRVYQEDPQAVDLIILDLGMPGMGGKKCLDELLNIDSRARVIIASGYSAQGLVAETLKAGALEFIGKPYRLNQMLDKIRIVLDKG